MTYMPRLPPDELVEVNGQPFLLRTECVDRRAMRDAHGKLQVDVAGELVMELIYHVYHVRAAKGTRQGS